MGKRFEDSDLWRTLCLCQGFDPDEIATVDELKKRLGRSTVLFRAPQFANAIPAARQTRMVLAQLANTDEETGELTFDFEGPVLITGLMPVITEGTFNQFQDNNKRLPTVNDFFVRILRDRDMSILSQNADGTKDLAGRVLEDQIDLAALDNRSGSGRLMMLCLGDEALRPVPKLSLRFRSKFAAPSASGIPYTVQISVNAFYTPLDEA